MDRAEREQRRDSFLGEAESYFVARPGYPSELLEAAVLLGGLASGSPLLEVGCGTGEATEWLAARGFPVLAMDRSPEMIDFARKRLQRFDQVELRVQDFEERPTDGRFAGLILATAYHWLDPDSRARRCADSLEVGGALILLWHTHPRPYTGFHDRSQSIYRRIVPGWTPPASPGMSEDKIDAVFRELESGRFFDSPQRRTHDWHRTYDRDLYLRLLDTYSDHRLLAEEQRRTLYRELGNLIDDEFDGEVERPYRTELIVARRREERGRRYRRPPSQPGWGGLSGRPSPGADPLGPPPPGS